MDSRSIRPDRTLVVAAELGVFLVVMVVLAAAAIRIAESGALRPFHRAAASLEVIAVAWLGWMAWRLREVRPRLFRAALLALGLSAVLSLIGIAAGQRPGPLAAALNLLGGLALAATFAWIWGLCAVPGRGETSRRATRWTRALGALLVVQAVIGARLSLFEHYVPALPVHALLALALAALIGWLALARVRGLAGNVLFALALAAPVTGFSVLQYEYSPIAAIVHAGAVALLIAAFAYAAGRGA